MYFSVLCRKCSEDAEDADVRELCGSAPPHPVRCPVVFLGNHFHDKMNTLRLLLLVYPVNKEINTKNNLSYIKKT